jgi:hypothetical protein
MVCTYSQWSILRTTWKHSDLAIHTRIAEEEKRLPFPLLGIHTDNGGEPKRSGDRQPTGCPQGERSESIHQRHPRTLLP